MDQTQAVLSSLPPMAFGFLLVIARVGTTLLIGPGLGESEIPPTVRIAFAVLLSVLVYPLVRSDLPPMPDTVPGLVGLLAIEIIVGAWMGFIARVLVMALAMAGGIVSLMVGLSSVLQIDPTIGAQVPSLERMMGLAAIALLFESGLYLLPIEAIVGSYKLIPPGTSFDAAGGAQLATRAVADSFGLALRLAAPFVIIAFIWYAALGFVSRMIPNIQVYFVAAPAQIASGLVLLIAGISVMFTSWSTGILNAFSSLPGL